ncbi:SGT1 protein-domain-containing protein [Boletus reticuloceps]|uniref:SGT1 protein-domain-containing protein n=1 Tax=Boletus reticuloceps TaxID=495285 RepID=A0A8I3AFE0_9AGAM|nr:SGT1 protein-domain-containing protein [Boletus reticuloceps]
MDTFNRGPFISEDTLLYVLYPPPPLADNASCTSLAACITDLVPTLLPDFLWHRDPFQIKIALDPDARRGEDKNIIEGRVRVGDAIDDEWSAVWLLREISKRWDVVISASESDGEFLLIEAAESLPRWVNPSNAVNRVWIHSGRLHLIPLSHVSSPNKPRKRPRIPGGREHEDEDHLAADEEDEYITIEDALPLVRDASVDTLAPKAVEDIVWQRISGYPGAARNHVHTTMAYIPIDIARVLTVDQSLIQKPVETFYTRDAIQLRAVHKMARFPPRPNVLCRVKMTRTAYAQLFSQKFYPPKIFGSFKEKEGTAAWRWRDIGMKLACGFEMLFQESKNRADVVKSTAESLSSSAEARKDALRRSPDYGAYLTRLVTIGYFRDEIEGSQMWNELENKAADIYIETRRQDDMSRPSFAALFNAALSRAPETLLDADLAQAEDSDEWMNVDANDFDAMRASGSVMETHAMETDGGDVDVEDRVAKEQANKLRDLAAKVEQFVEGKGDVEGARFEDEPFSDEDGTDSDERSSGSDDEESNAETRKRNAARQQAMDNLVPALPASEYGRMPASFNTQRVAKTTILTEQVETGLSNPDAVTNGAVVQVGEPSSPVRTRSIRPPLLPRDKYEGVDSDDESSSSDPLAGGDDEDAESEEDRPQVVGEIEVDMNEEEAEFLEFSRQALGISDEMWDDIIKERRGRGAFVPRSVTTAKKATVAPKTTAEQPRQPVPDARSDTNPKLDSFEAVMQAMDAELLSLQQSAARPEPQSQPPLPTKEDKGKDVDVDMDIEASMQAELEGLLEREDDGDSDEEGDKPSMDYNLIKNLLESFKSQGGLSGPVGNLAGRLQPGWTLPRDEA